MFNIVAIVTSIIKTDLLALYNTSYTITQVNRRDDNAYNSGKILDNDSYQKYTLIHISRCSSSFFYYRKITQNKKVFRKKLLIHKTDNLKFIEWISPSYYNYQL